MFRKSYFYYAFVIVIAIAIISISSCEKDEVFEEDLAAITHHKIKAGASSLSRIKNTDSKLYNYLSERALTSLKSGNTGSGEILDTSYIQILEGTDYKNYIFRVVTYSTNTADVLKNYMLVILKDSIQQQFMVTYPYVNQVVDTTNVLIEPVFGTDILNQFTLKCGGSSFQSVWIPGSTESYPCASGRHVFSQGTACDYWEKPSGARVVYTAGYFITQYVEQQHCETIGTGSLSNGGGGANVNNPNPPLPDDPDDEDEDEPDMEIGITPNEELSPEIVDDPKCNLIAVMVNDSTFQGKVDSLERNINRRNETGFLVNKGYNDEYNFIYKDNTSRNGATINMSIENNTVGSLHVHQDNYTVNGVINPRTGQIGEQETRFIKMFSPKDVDWLLDATTNTQLSSNTDRQNEINAQEVFTGMISRRGNYIIKYEGSVSELEFDILPQTINFRDTTITNPYLRNIDEDRESGLLTFLEDEFGITKVSLYRFKSNGDIFRIELDENGKKNKYKCHDEN